LRLKVKKATQNEPADVDLLCAYIGTHGNWDKQRALNWMLRKAS
jgi:hypothetical protein